MAEPKTPLLRIQVYNLALYGVPRDTSKIEVKGVGYGVIVQKGVDSTLRDECINAVRQEIEQHSDGQIGFLEVKVDPKSLRINQSSSQ